MNNPKASIFFDYRKPVTKGQDCGRCHVKILVSFYDRGIRQRRYYKTNVFATREEFNKIMSGKFGKGNTEEMGAKRAALLQLETKAKKDLENWTSIDEFEKRFYSKGNYESPLDFMDAYAEEMEQAGRIGNRDNHRQAKSSFHKFNKKGVLTFSMVTPTWLMKYENWMLEQDKSISTVGIYCRAMRTIFNLARSDRYKTIPMDMYPFGKGKYQIPTGKGRKIALSEEQKNKVLTFKTLNSNWRKAVDMWVFSYYCNGMNFADIARLRFRDIDGDVLVFLRTKSKRTKRDQEEIVAVVNETVKGIIASWGNKSDNRNDYVFPILRAGLTPSQIKDRIHDFIEETNDYLAEACEQMKLPKITTYWARHTHASILLGKGASMAQIQKNLGHATEAQTRAYTSSLDIETRKKVANML